MDALPSSKNQDLMDQYSKGKGKSKKKIKMESPSSSESPSKLKPKDPQKSTPPHSFSNSRDSSSKSKKNKGEPCYFYGKYGNDEFPCFKRLEALEEAIGRHNISMPKSSSMGKGKDISTHFLYSSIDSWILDLVLHIT